MFRLAYRYQFEEKSRGKFSANVHVDQRFFSSLEMVQYGICVRCGA